MPELPEVETIVRFLNPKVSGRKILGTDFFSKRVVRDHKNLSDLKTKIIGQKIQSVERVGKYVVLRFSPWRCLLFHLMMTGKILLNPKQAGKHDRLILVLSGGNRLVFNDVRQFGKCKLVAATDNLVGADPLKIDFQKFKKLFRNRNKNIKNFLLDQKYLAGIGNIYADETLWDAGISPLRNMKSFNHKEIKKLYDSTKKILKLAIRRGGTSSRNYRKPDNTEGGYYKIRKAYQRSGEKCKKCGGVIHRIILGGRSTHFCPEHQI